MALLTPKQIGADLERLFLALPESKSIMRKVEAKMLRGKPLDDAEAAIALMLMKDKPELQGRL